MFVKQEGNMVREGHGGAVPRRDFYRFLIYTQFEDNLPLSERCLCLHSDMAIKYVSLSDICYPQLEH
jgi:hypothetical protein